MKSLYFLIYYIFLNLFILLFIFIMPPNIQETKQKFGIIYSQCRINFELLSILFIQA